MGVTLADVQRGYNRWAAKPHNAKWVRKIDGTPIANDLVVNIFDELKERDQPAENSICQSCGYNQKAHDYVQHVLGACAEFTPFPQEEDTTHA